MDSQTRTVVSLLEKEQELFRAGHDDRGKQEEYRAFKKRTEEILKGVSPEVVQRARQYVDMSKEERFLFDATKSLHADTNKLLKERVKLKDEEIEKQKQLNDLQRQSNQEQEKSIKQQNRAAVGLGYATGGQTYQDNIGRKLTLQESD